MNYFQERLEFKAQNKMCVDLYFYYRTALYNIAEDLDSTEIEKLKQEAINMVPNIIPALRKVTSMYDFLDVLEKRLLISHHSSDIFLVMLERINRSDLGIFIKEFSGKSFSFI